MKEPKATCSTCRYYETAGATCHRWPPSPMHNRAYFRFPGVEANDWCGEHRSKPIAQATKEGAE